MILFLDEDSGEQVLSESVIANVEQSINAFLNKFKSLSDFISLGLKFIESLSKDALRIVNRQIQIANAFVERTKKEYKEFFRTQNLINSAGNLTEASSPVEARYKQFAKMTKDGYTAYVKNCFAQFDAAKLPEASVYILKYVALSVLACVIGLGFAIMLMGGQLLALPVGLFIATILITPFIDEHYRRQAILDGYGAEYAVLSFFISVLTFLSPALGVGVIKKVGNIALNFFISYLLTKRIGEGDTTSNSTVIVLRMLC